MSESHKGRTYTPEQRLHYRESKLGNKNPMFKNGEYDRKLNKYIRELNEYKIWRKSVFNRDGHKCMRCDSVGYVEAHHIISFVTIVKEYGLSSENITKEELIINAQKYDKLWNVSNGITLCRKCHMIEENKKYDG